MRLGWIGAGAALLVVLAACASVREYIDVEQINAPPPPIVEAPADMPAFTYSPLTPPALLAHVARLASDEFEGRAPSTRGEELTVDYISRAFATAGLEPGAPQRGARAGWHQTVPIVASQVMNAPSLNVTGADGARSYVFGDQAVIWTKRQIPRIDIADAELVFVGYGVISPELGWNDYSGVDMRGKIAVILVNDPDFETGDDRGFRGRAMTYFGRWTYKFEEAARQGAAGAIIIHDPRAAGYGWGVVRSSWSGVQYDLARDDQGADRVGVEGWITQDVAADLFQRANIDFAAERLRAQRPDFTPRPLGLRASVALDMNIQTTTSRNVVGILRGRSRPDETVIYAAHWDHLGHCTPVDGDDICNGALDNASGVAGLIELARRFTTAGRLQRSIVFIAFTAEEAGLLGSAYYAEHPIYEPGRTAAMINMDGLNIIGPTRDMTLVGAGQNELEYFLALAAHEQSRSISEEAFPERGSYYRSDHFNFARIGVPTLYAGAGADLYTGGVERGRALSNAYVAERYHKPNDELTADWDMTGAMRDLLVLYEVGRRVGEGNQWPDWREGSEFAGVRDQTSAMRTRAQ